MGWNTQSGADQYAFTHTWPCLGWVWSDVGSPEWPSHVIHGEGRRGIASLRGLGNTAQIPVQVDPWHLPGDYPSSPASEVQP